jgi:hypothetical protein
MNPSDYGVTGLTDPGLDLRSAAEAQVWYRRQWRTIGNTLGFGQSLARRYDTASSVSIAGENQVGLSAFASAFRNGDPQPESEVQASVLTAVIARGREGGLWRTVDDVATLPSGACYAAEDGSRRAFFPDTAPGYFGEGWAGPPPRAESTCGWDTPLVLHLGTFPWVYSGGLEGVGPGLRWPLAPARLGLSVVASLLEPETNLRQDARQVAAIFRTFTAHTLGMIQRLPVVAGPGTWSASSTRLQVGQMFLRDGEVHVHQSSLHVAGFQGPRGRFSALAYNYCMARFAAFFAVRDATIRALPSLPPHLQQLALASPDPVLRHYSTQSLGR